MTLSLRTRILLTVSPLLLIISGLGGTGAVLLVQLGHRSDAILRENYDSVRAMHLLNEAIERIDVAFQLALVGHEADAHEIGRAHV